MRLFEGISNKIKQRIKNYLDLNINSDALSKSRAVVSPDYLLAGSTILPNISSYLKLDFDLMSRYVDYEDMDDYPVISTAYDIYADDSCQLDLLKNATIWCESSHSEIKTMINDLLYNRLDVEQILWELVRNLVKYGNDFEEIVASSRGVEKILYIPTPTMRRIEDRGTLYGFVQDTTGQASIDYAMMIKMLQKDLYSEEQWNLGNIILFNPYEVVHFRLLSKLRSSLYGFGIGESARWLFKRLVLLQDAMLIHKLTRATSRLVFYIDTGDVNFADAMKYADMVRQSFKRRKFIDPSTGKLDMRYNPLSEDEDFFIPVVGGRETTRIETLGGLDYQNIDVVEYFDKLIYSALKIPKSYLSFDEDVKGKAVLSMEDIRFARTIMRIQREVRNGFTRIVDLHLTILGIDPNSVDYDIVMTTPSSILELAQLEAMNAKMEFANKIGDYVSEYWIFSKLFGFNDEQIEKIYKQKEDEAYIKQKIEYDASRRFEEYKSKFEQKLPEKQASPEGAGDVILNKDSLVRRRKKAGGKEGSEFEDAVSSLIKDVYDLHNDTGDGRKYNYGYLMEKVKSRSGKSLDEIMNDVMKGNKDLEKKLEDNFDKILAENRELKESIYRLSGFMNDLKANLGGIRRR